MERIKTYSKNIDQLLHGGFPRGSTILISGPPGTGKTIFSLQTLLSNASDNKCIYLTFEEKKNALISQISQFSDTSKNIVSKNLEIISLGSDDISKDTIDEIIDLLKEKKPFLVVIDSITTLSYVLPSEASLYNNMRYSLKNFL